MRGIKFIKPGKVLIDLKTHWDIMEDVIDRIKVKEAMRRNDFTPLGVVKAELDKKHATDDIRSNSRQGRKEIPKRVAKKRSRQYLEAPLPSGR